MKQQHRGFSLIELMIVIVIIGILGSMAVPAYKDYVIRAKVTELFAMALPAKLAVTEALMFSIPATEITDQSLNFKKIENQGKIKELTIANAIITITANSQALDLPENTHFQIALKPILEDGMISWNCTATPTELQKYAPANCRGNL